MPRLLCPCGESISLSPVPNPNGFHLVPERAIEPLVDAVAALHAQSESAQDFEHGVWALARNPGLPPRLQVYECPQCQRLAVFRRASDASPLAWYQRERDAPGVSKSAPSLSEVAAGDRAPEKPTPKE